MGLGIRVKLGDIFQIPLDATRFGYGQVVAQPEKKVLFICVFAAVTERGKQPNLDAVTHS